MSETIIPAKERQREIISEMVDREMAMHEQGPWGFFNNFPHCLPYRHAATAKDNSAVSDYYLLHQELGDLDTKIHRGGKTPRGRGW